MCHPNYKTRRILAFSRKRYFTDSLTWSVFFLLTIGFCTIFLWYLKHPLMDVDKDWSSAFFAIIRISLTYTLMMMIPVYINLIVLKKYTLDQIKHRVWSYVIYLLAVIFNAILFAGLLHFIYQLYPSYFNIQINFPINFLAILGIQLIATGMIYRRKVRNLNAVLGRYKFLVDKKKEELTEIKKILDKDQHLMSQRHLKLGTKYHFWIIQFEDILYIKGDGNEPRFFTNLRAEAYRGNESMYYYENILPESRFLRVHKSFIVAKPEVIGRSRTGNNKFLILKGNIKIPIGKTYESQVEADQYLSFIIL